MRVDLLTDRVECLRDDFFHLWHHMLVHVKVFFRVELIYDGLEPRERELVAVLEVTVVFAVFLHGIVGQVNKRVVHVGHVDAELRRSRSKVALLEEVEVVLLCETDPDSDVEFTLEDEQGSLEVLLNDECVVADLHRVVVALFLLLGFRFLTLTV